MKSLFILIAAAIFIAPSLFAQNLSQREKRLKAKTKFQIDKSIENTPVFDETIFADIKPEKSLKSATSENKTVRANTIDNSAVLKPVATAKKRKNTHLREWP